MQQTRRRLLIVLILLLIAVITGLLLSHRRGAPTRHEFVTQLPGEAHHVWRSFRTVWSFLPSFPNLRSDVNDLVMRQDRLYYINNYEAGCLDKASGSLVWKHSFVARKVLESVTYFESGGWHLSDDARCIYICHCPDPTPRVTPSRLYALDKKTGKLLWEHILSTLPQTAPCVAGDLLLLPGVDGTVTALRASNGEPLWQRKLNSAKYDPQSSNPGMVLRAENGIAVAQLGAGRLVGFRAEDGKALWDVYKQGSTAESAEDGDSDGFVLKEGVVYALLADSEMVALQAQIGKPLWRRQCEGYGTPTPQVQLLGDKVISTPFGILTVLRRTDGGTLWYDRSAHFEGVYPVRNAHAEDASRRAQATPPDEELFVKTDSPPLLDKTPRMLQSLPDLPTLVALDPTTGKERWRWQPEDGESIACLISDDRRLYLADGQRILAIEEGEPAPLPSGKEERRRLAERMASSLLLWPEPEPNLMERIGDKFPAVTSHLPQAEEPTIEENEAKLTLVRLGKESVPTLLDYIAHEINQQDQNAPPPNTPPGNWNADFHLGQALNLLLDIDDKTIIPALVQHLENAKHPDSRGQLADTLIRFGDLRALSALFRYAQTAIDGGPPQASLYFVCRHAPQTARTPQEAPTQAQVTAYLMAQLNDPKAPLWLRLFARFELLNNRGEAARKAALATFYGNKNPQYKPHPLTDEEGIYQAVIEALCQYGRATASDKHSNPLPEYTFPYGSAKPLRLLLPPGSKGIEIRGHAGKILFAPLRVGEDLSALRFASHFCSPHIDLDGLWTEDPDPKRWDILMPGDPFAPPNESKPAAFPNTFHDYFPYLRSPDGRRARVCWSAENPFEGSVDFDIEVRKIEGQWVPVECRQVAWYSHHGASTLAVPLHKLP